MREAIGEMLPFAVACNLSPVALIAVILLLFSPRPASNSLAFLVAWMLTLAVSVGVVELFSGLLGSVVSTSTGTLDVVVTYFRLVLGLVLLGLGLRRTGQLFSIVPGRRQSRQGEDAGEVVEEQESYPWWIAGIDAFNVTRTFGVSVLVALVGNAPWLLAGGVSIGRARLALPATLFVILLYMLIGSVAVGAIVLYYFLRQQRAAALLTVLKEWLAAHNQMVSGVMLLVFGVYLLVQGIKGLGLFGSG